MPTYVIITSKPGQFRTEPGDGLLPIEAWDYHCDGRVRARFLVAELPALRAPVGEVCPLRGAVAQPMWRAASVHRPAFVTPMVAVAGAVVAAAPVAVPIYATTLS